MVHGRAAGSWSAGARRSREARRSGPRSRSNGRTASSSARRRASGGAGPPAGRRGRPAAGSSGAGGAITCTGWPSALAEGGAQRTRGGGPPRRGRAARTAGEISPRDAQRLRRCCRPACPGCRRSRNQSRSWAKESGAALPSQSPSFTGPRPASAPARTAGATKRSARSARTGASKTACKAISTPNAALRRETSRVAEREWPPSAKKLSFRPTVSTPRTSFQIWTIRSSSGVRGGSAARSSPCRPELLQGAAVDLAVRRQGEGVEDDEGRGEHVLRQPRGQGAAQGGGRRRLPHRSRHVGHQAALAARTILARQHHGLAHIGLGGQRGLDLPQLDAEAADLDLAVDAAEVLQIAVRPAAGEVPRAVEPRARLAGEGIGDEALGREVRTAEVPLGEPGLAGPEAPTWISPGVADRHRPQERVQQVDGEVREGPADRASRRQVRPPHRPPGDVHGGLGDPVHVDQPRPLVAVAGEPGGEARRLQGLAAEDHPAQGKAGSVAAGHRRLRGLFSPDELAEGRRGLVEDGDPLLRHQPVELLGRAARPVGHHHQPAAVEQRPPDLPDREVEGVGVEERPDVVRAETEPGGGRREQAVDAGVRDHHPLRPAGRSGGVDDVGREVGGSAGTARRSVP